jgi:hypothetical protein
MITIIKMGQIPNTPPEYRTTCYYCKTIFEHSESDCTFVMSCTDFDMKQVECPLCKNKVKPQTRKNLPDAPIPRPLKPKNAIYELLTDYTILGKKVFRFNPKRNS